jgi:hypothetical protein
MKHLVFLVIMSFAAAGWAQAPKEPAKPEPMKEAPKAEAPKAEAPKAEPMKEPAKRAAAPGKPRRWNEDARHCLEKGSNTDIIKCAEEFL